MTINWPTVQARLGVKPDGIPGAITYAALLPQVSGRSVALATGFGLALAVNVPSYGVDANPDRLAAFLGQYCHETSGFVLMHEIWGPTPQQRGYEGRQDLGNTHPGDGFLFRGRGWPMLTGRDNYARFGPLVGLDLIKNPELLEQPAPAVLAGLEFWKSRNLNVMADLQDDSGITRRINGGATGLAQRIAYTNHARGLLS